MAKNKKINENKSQTEIHAGKTKRPLSALFTGVLMLAVISWVGLQTTGEANVPPLFGSGGSTVYAPPSGEMPRTDGTWNQQQPLEQAVGVEPMANPDYRMIALPENGRVDIKYFETVTFAGDSLTQGLQIYTDLQTNYCAYKSIGPKGFYDGSEWVRPDQEKEVPMDALVESRPDNVYILLGANVINSMQDDAFIEYYRTMLQKMRENMLPGVGFYIQTITPVRPDAKFSMDRIRTLNNRLAQLAYEEGVYFLDLNEPLADEDGYLREDFASRVDGIHMTPAGYAAWVEYLATHTAYHPRNPYLQGAPNYQPPPDSSVPGEENLPEEAPAP